jgi:hypothetical protein
MRPDPSVLCLLFAGILSLIIGIFSTLVAGEQWDCVYSDDFALSYPIWLLIDGIVLMVVGALILIFAIAAKFVCGNLPMEILFTLAILQYAWAVVGSVLFFAQVFSSCAINTVIYEFGLGIFILQTIAVMAIVAYSLLTNCSEE